MFKNDTTLFPRMINFLTIAFVVALNLYCLAIVATIIRAALLGAGRLIIDGISPLLHVPGWSVSRRIRSLSLREIALSLGIALIGITVLVWIDSRQKKALAPAATAEPGSVGGIGNNGTTPPRAMSETQPVII